VVVPLPSPATRCRSSLPLTLVHARSVRWCVSGRPRLSLSVDDKPESTEVISTYTFDSAGRIYEHQVDQIIPPESPLVQLMEWLVGRLQPKASGLQPQLPMPGLRDW
jgi:hypothetical protein